MCDPTRLVQPAQCNQVLETIGAISPKAPFSNVCLFFVSAPKDDGKPTGLAIDAQKIVAHYRQMRASSE